MSFRRCLSLIGPPGSGKGTYGSILASRLPNSVFVGSGDILREIAEQTSDLGRTVREKLQSGTLVNDEFVSNLVLSHIEKLNNRNDHLKAENVSGSSTSHEHGGFVILDGFPRNQSQSSLISAWPNHFQPSLAIYFDVPDKICTTKLMGRRKCSVCHGNFNVNAVDTHDGFFMPPILPASKDSCRSNCNWDQDWKRRDDDTEETIKRRLEVFHDQTEPVLNFWHDRGQLLTFVPYNGVKDMNKLVSLLTTRLSHQKPKCYT